MWCQQPYGGKGWTNTQVCLHTDNMSVVALLQNRTVVRDPLACHLLRCLYFYTALYGFKHSVEHVPGRLDVAADALSRDNLFSSLLPQARPTSVPTSVTSLLLSNKPDWGSTHWIRSFLRYLSQCLALATLAVYNSASSHSHWFCKQVGMQPLPLQQETLLCFVAYLFDGGLAFSHFHSCLS